MGVFFLEVLKATLLEFLCASLLIRAVNKVPLHELQLWMDKTLSAAEVSKATRKLANGKSGGDAKV